MKANDQYSTDNSSTNEWKDGTYDTIAHGRNADFDIEVGIKDHQIKQIKISDHNSESKGIGSKAVAELPSRIIKAQSTNVDAISGATVTSNAIKYAIRDVLDKNRD
nr:FMN-binding protein [Lactobacillus helveticus]